MAISTYNDLAAAVKAYCARSDTTFSNMIETFVAQHEIRMYDGSDTQSGPLSCDALAVPEIEASGSIVVTAGVGPLPEPLNALRLVFRDGDRVGLNYLTPRQFALAEANRSGGQPSGYTVKGTNIYVTPSEWAGSLSIVYYLELPSISTSNQSNALLLNYPLLYLQGTLFEAFTFMQAQDLALAWFARYKASLAGANQSARGVRYGGVPLRVVPQVSIP